MKEITNEEFNKSKKRGRKSKKWPYGLKRAYSNVKMKKYIGQQKKCKKDTHFTKGFAKVNPDRIYMNK